MAIEFVIVAVVIGNLFCATLGFMAGRSFGSLSVDLDAAKKAAKKATEKLELATQKAIEETSALDDAEASFSKEKSIAEIINRELSG